MQHQPKNQMKNIGVFIAINFIILSYLEFGSTDSERYQKGVTAYQNENFTKAFNIMSSLADKEYLEAEFFLSTLYSKGQGVEINQELAGFWHNKAVQHKVRLEKIASDPRSPSENSQTKNSSD